MVNTSGWWFHRAASHGAIAHTGDIAVISIYDPETGEIAAFEELIGAHEGLGGAQTRPFLLHPSDWKMDQAPLVGAPVVYRQLRRWMEQELGFAFGPPASDSGRAEGSSVDAETQIVPATEADGSSSAA